MKITRYIFDTEEDWLQYRTGIFTSSEINRLMAEPTKKAQATGEVLSEGAKTYILEKVAAMLGSPKPNFFNAEMQWGKDTEPEAALTFCNLAGYDVTADDVIYTSQGGLVFFSTEMSGGTPDMILPDAIAEFKCPNSVTHLYYKTRVTVQNIQDELPNYYDQMQHNMFLCERDKCFFMSFDPRLSKGNTHILEVPRNEQRIEQILFKIEDAHEYKLKVLEAI